MAPILLSFGTFCSTMFGGITAIKNQKRLHYILGLTAGVILGVVAFDLLPEIFKLVNADRLNSAKPMIALVLGFLLFHIMEKTLLLHHAHETEYGKHRHPHVGVFSALVSWTVSGSGWVLRSAQLLVWRSPLPSSGTTLRTD
jgi:ZIP family zinc transporter